MKWAAGVALFGAVLAVGSVVPERQASAQVQAVPRVGMAFARTVTQRVTIESVDAEDRVLTFSRPDGQYLTVPVAEGLVRTLGSLQEGAMADVTYNEVVTILNLRQKGPGSKEARREQMTGRDATDVEIGRFTVTVVGVDLPNNTVSVIDGRGGVVQTYKADTIAKQDMLKKIKVGDVVIGITTPLLVTAITPVQ
jgi:hypothetical protein